MKTPADNSSGAPAETPPNDPDSTFTVMRRRASLRGTLRLYGALWRFASGHRWRMALSSALLVASQLAKLAIPWLAAQAINTIQTAAPGSVGQAGIWAALILLVCAASWAMHGPGRVMERSVSIRVRGNLADTLYARLANVALAWHESHHTGETLHRVEKTTAALADFAQSQFIYLQAMVNLAGPIVALALLSDVVGTSALIGYAAIGIVIISFDRAMMRLAERQLHAERRYSAALIDCLSNVSTVLALRLQSVTRALLGARLAHVFEPLKRNIVLTEWKWCAVDLLSITLSWSLVGLYAWTSQRNGQALLIGDLFMVYQYTQQAGGVIGSIAVNFQQFARMQTDYASADPIWRAPQRRAAVGDAPAHWRQIAVEGLHFRYGRRAGDGASLDNVSLTFHRGERIALVGPSGAGKSTLMRVLAGLYDAGHGAFIIDGEVAPDRRHFGDIATLIPQDADVFEATVRDNLTFGAAIPKEKVHAAMELSAFDAALQTLPHGLDTVISERGMNLSGGQRQRLGLARGLLAAGASSLILLDEPTASLDAVTEARVVDGLSAGLPDACIVCSVHRLHLLPHFHRVVLMDRGRVIDTGSVNELLERQPLFADLWRRHGGASDAAQERLPAQLAAA